MGQLGDSINYILFYNPISQELGKVLKKTGIVGKNVSSPVTPPTPIIMQKPLYQLVREAGPWLRVGGLLGASAVVLGAYGAHKTYPEGVKKDLKKLCETANRFHFIHSLALLAVPLSRYPTVSGSLMVTGMALFCGSCYYHAFTGDESIRRLAPIGGSCLILAWLSLVL